MKQKLDWQSKAAVDSAMTAPPTKAETPGIKSFFARYWQFVLWGAVFLTLTLNNTVFKWLGALTYLPLLTFGVFVLAFIIRYILNKTTTDAYINTDAYEADFASLPAIHKVWLTQIQLLVYVIVIAILASKVMGQNPSPNEDVAFSIPDIWQCETPTPDIELRPEWSVRLDVIASGIARDRSRYEAIQNMRENGMLWFFVGAIHERESSRNFTRHLHEGSPLIYRTRYIPKGRLPNVPPPYTFTQSAEDALYVLKHEDRVIWCEQAAALDAIEAYNGFGYRNYHSDVKSPYLYSGTVAYERGKYIADGRFSAISVDQQAGVVALWLRMKQRGLL